MEGPFEELEYQAEIRLIKIIPGYTNQSTGAWVKPVEESLPIPGMIVDKLKGKINHTNVLEEWQRDSGKITFGNRLLRTSYPITVGDDLEIIETNGDISRWHVDGIERRFLLLEKLCGIRRTSYTLQQIEAPIVKDDDF